MESEPTLPSLRRGLLGPAYHTFAVDSLLARFGLETRRLCVLVHSANSGTSLSPAIDAPHAMSVIAGVRAGVRGTSSTSRRPLRPSSGLTATFSPRITLVRRWTSLRGEKASLTLGTRAAHDSGSGIAASVE